MILPCLAQLARRLPGSRADMPSAAQRAQPQSQSRKKHRNRRGTMHCDPEHASCQEGQHLHL